MAGDSKLEMVVSAMKAEMREEVKQMEAKYEKHIERLTKSNEMSERAFSILFKRVCTLEEEKRVAEKRMSDGELRRVIEGVVRGILNERKGEDVKTIIDEHTEEIARLKGVSKECLGELKKIDFKLQSMKEELEEEFKGQMTTTGDLIGEILTNLEADNAKMNETIRKLKEGFGGVEEKECWED